MLGRSTLLRPATLLRQLPTLHNSAPWHPAPNFLGSQRFAGSSSRIKQAQHSQAAVRKAQLRAAAQSFAVAREASVRDAPPDAAGGSGLQLPLYRSADDVGAVYDSLLLPDNDVGKTRVRQHVNPLSRKLQQLPPPVDWGTVFADPRKPLVVDIGCASGRWLLLLARDCGLHCNFLGLDIRPPLIDRAAQWVEKMQISDFIHFRLQNATIGFDHLLSTYPGPLELTAIQCPDPQFKARHHKRRIVQPGLVQAIGRRLSPTGLVYLSSDVHEVAVDMRQQFEAHASTSLQVSPLHEQLPTFDQAEEISHTPTPPLPPPASPTAAEVQAAAGAARPSLTEQSPQEPESEWAKKRWLAVNPIGLPTEREHWVTCHGLPMFRMLLCRKQRPIS